MKTALLVIDVQNDYFPGGRMELQGSSAALDNLGRVIAKSRAEGVPVLYIQHIAIKKEATFFIAGTSGIDIHPDIAPAPGEKVFVKHYPNSFRNTGLFEYCQQNQITSLVITGMMTHMCVDTTTRAAFDLGFTSTLLADCCATRNLQYLDRIVLAADVQNAYLAALDKTFAQVLTTKQYLHGEH